jgi:hypothetical protein
MLGIYCRAHHLPKDEFCSHCRTLFLYAEDRLTSCPFQEGKTTCVKCKVHCYSPAKRDEIKKVMRYSGPRILCHRPLLSILHVIDGLRNKPIVRKTRTKI